MKVPKKYLWIYGDLKHTYKEGFIRDRHRFVMEKHLKRRLTFNEVVHHKNGDTSDDRLENLELLLRPKHSSSHRKGVPLSEETKKKLSDIHKKNPFTSTHLWCSRCKQMKLHSDFYKSKRGFIGLCNICKKCWSIEQKRYRMKNNTYRICAAPSAYSN
jgi:hypothetical protein